MYEVITDLDLQSLKLIEGGRVLKHIRCNDNTQMFASLIEKCYAKFYGGYHAIHKLGLEVNINLVNPI